MSELLRESFHRKDPTDERSVQLNEVLLAETSLSTAYNSFTEEQPAIGIHSIHCIILVCYKASSILYAYKRIVFLPIAVHSSSRTYEVAKYTVRMYMYLIKLVSTSSRVAIINLK